MANVFEKKTSFSILYDKVGYHWTNPHIDEPDFQVEDLEFHLAVVKRGHRETKRSGTYALYAVYMDLSEASKKALMPGYEIVVKEIRSEYQLGKFDSITGPHQPCLPHDAVELLRFTTGDKLDYHQFDVKLVMEFNNIQQRHIVPFVDAEAAKEKLSDCKIVLEDDENKEIFVHKAILAMSSPVFRTLFDGDDKDVVKLSDVKQTDLLEYLSVVYPKKPSRPFTFKKLDTLLILADRFQNDELMASIESFLMEMKDKSSQDKHQILYWADRYDMKTLFSATLKAMSKDDLKNLDKSVCKKFTEDNIELLVTYFVNYM